MTTQRRTIDRVDDGRLLRRGKHSLSLTIALVSSALVLAAGADDQAGTAAIGGTGGVPYHAACAPDEVLVGLVMRATAAKVPLVQWLESAYPVCSKVNANGQWSGAHAHHRDLSVGAWALARPPAFTPAQAPFTRVCPANSAVTGIQGYAGSFLDRLQLACRPLTNPQRASGAAVILDMFPKTVSPAVTVSLATCGNFSFEMTKGESIPELLIRLKDQLGAAASCLLPSNWTIKPVTITPPAVLPKEAGGPSKIGLRECAGGRPATGLHGTAGATVDPVAGNPVGPMYVDSLGLTCVDEDEWRPRYHFTPQRGWMNDPAGLAFANGRYQLYFQSIVDALPVSSLAFMAKKVVWGHAHSTNLIDWTRADPVFPAAGGPGGKAPFTGSAVVLENSEEPCKSNCRSGGQCLAAIFTRHLIPAGPQAQVVTTSCSTGPGFTQQFSSERPILLQPPLGLHFRDPKLVWFENRALKSGGFWVMVVAAGDHIRFYRSCLAAADCSGNLTTWTLLQDSEYRRHLDFPRGAATGPFFETPDFFPLPVSNAAGTTRWVLTFAKGYIPPSAGPLIGRKEYSESWYQVGTFDGLTFRRLGDAKRLDAGPDFYAGQTWFLGRSASKRTITAGWQNNWRYAHLLPTSRWKGHLSIPRELTLQRTATEAEEYVLIQRPVAELATKRMVRRPVAWQVRDAPLTPASLKIAGFAEKQFEIQTTLQIGSNAREVQIKIRDGAAPGRLVVGWRRSADGAAGQGELYVDRRNGYAGGGPVPDGFSGDFSAPMNLPDEKTVDLRILVDRSSVEVFGAGGRVVLSAVFFPDPVNTGLEVRIAALLPTAAPRPAGRPPAPPTLTAAVSRIISFDVYRLAQGDFR